MAVTATITLKDGHVLVLPNINYISPIAEKQNHREKPASVTVTSMFDRYVITYPNVIAAEAEKQLMITALNSYYTAMQPSTPA